MTATVLPLLAPCPGCAGRGLVVVHTNWCRTRYSSACDCAEDGFCPCCEGAGKVPPVQATWWTCDAQNPAAPRRGNP